MFLIIRTNAKNEKMAESEIAKDCMEFLKRN